MKVRRRGVSWGGWQLCAAANVTGSNILSVYPTRGETAGQELLNQTYQPASGHSTTTIAVMWSSNRDPTQEFWTANHVVPLLPVMQPDQIICEEQPNHPPQNAAPSTKRNAQMNDFVTARVLPANGNVSKAKTYIGVVRKVEEEGVNVLFMKKASSNSLYYIWPDMDDPSFVLHEEIVAIMDAPVIDGRGRYMFQ